MDKQRLSSLLEKHAAGKCSADEANELHIWFDRASDVNNFNWTLEEQAKVNHRLKAKINRAMGSAPKRQLHSFPYLKIAASVILVLSFSLFWAQKNSPKKDSDPIKYATSTATVGKRMNLKLSDGSIITLNAGSKVRYPLSFNGKERLVELLEGEAFFDVAHDADKPFIVIAGKTRTHVLGTAFNIRSYASFADVQITVARGKVGVMKTDKSQKPAGPAELLLPNDQLVINKSTGNVIRQTVNANEAIGWISGKQIFNNESLANVTTILENTYGVKFAFTEKDMEKIRFSASYDSTDSFNEIIFSIAKANNLMYVQQGNCITFKQHHTNKSEFMK